MHPNTKHGLTRTRIYEIWCSMKKRCLNKNATNYSRYGARGITVCERWMKFENFLEDMHDGYDKKLSLDRIDNNGNYCKENCRWATPKEQSANSIGRRKKYLLNGEETDLYKMAEKYKLKTSTLKSRLRKGVPPELAVKLNSNKHSGYGKRYNKFA